MSQAFATSSPPLRSARALHRAEDIGSALKGGVDVCQRQRIKEVLGPLVRSSFAILAARARHLVSAAPMPAFSVAPRPSNSSDIMRSASQSRPLGPLVAC